MSTARTALSTKTLSVLRIGRRLLARRCILERAHAKEIATTRSVARRQPGTPQYPLARRIGGGGIVVLRGGARPAADPVFVARSAASAAA
jgi:hypothetical protein